MLRALMPPVLTLLAIMGIAPCDALGIEPSEAVPSAIQAYADSSYEGLFKIKVYEGDFSGDGKIDAIAFIYFAFVGGNSFGIDVSLFENRIGGLVHKRDVTNVYGTDPRDVRIARGVVEVTMTTLNSGDPRCCPTGETRFRIEPYIHDGTGIVTQTKKEKL